MSNLFWDSCVFYAYLDSQATLYIPDIERYLNEARNGQHRLYASSLVLAEVVPSAITRQGVGTFQDFVDDLQSAVTIVTPSPDVMHRTALLKDLPYKKGTSKGRRLSTTDAIMLASCIEIVETWNLNVDAFHTFDDGKKRGLEGKMVPLLSYQEWCEGFTDEQLNIVQPVIQLNRCKPEHPAPYLFPPGPTARN